MPLKFRELKTLGNLASKALTWHQQSQPGQTPSGSTYPNHDKEFPLRFAFSPKYGIGIYVALFLCWALSKLCALQFSCCLSVFHLVMISDL